MGDELIHGSCELVVTTPLVARKLVSYCVKGEREEVEIVGGSCCGEMSTGIPATLEQYFFEDVLEHLLVGRRFSDTFSDGKATQRTGDEYIETRLKRTGERL